MANNLNKPIARQNRIKGIKRFLSIVFITIGLVGMSSKENSTIFIGIALFIIGSILATTYKSL